MTTIHEAEQVSVLAMDILDGIFRAHSDGERYRGADDEASKAHFARAFLAALDDIVKATEAIWETMPRETFSSVTYAPVEVTQPPANSVHEAIHNAGQCYQDVAWKVLQATGTDLSPWRGSGDNANEYALPDRLPPSDVMREHVGVAVTAFFSCSPTEDQANRLSAMRKQELARVCEKLERETVATTSHAPIGGSREIGPVGVTLLAAAIVFNENDPEAAKASKDRWRKSRSPRLPKTIGKDPLHKQADLYEPAAILEFLETFETFDKPMRLQELMAIAKAPRPVK